MASLKDVYFDDFIGVGRRAEGSKIIFFFKKIECQSNLAHVYC